MAVAGSRVGSLLVSVRVRGSNLKSGPGDFYRPALLIQFYDGDRRPLEIGTLGPWQGSFDWKRMSKLVAVPARAREAIIRVGLNGGTGTLSVDDVRLLPQPRNAGEGAN
jgi:protein-L-isoaspartate(D-aspartate) O-methyltransferase